MFHVRKENDFTNRSRIGEQHNQTVDADTFACGRRHPVLQGFNVITIHSMGFFITGLAPFNLLAKALVLVHRIVEFGERIGQLHRVDEQLEALGDARVLG